MRLIDSGRELVAGAQVYENRTDITSFSYDSAKREWVSYDTPNIIRQKAKYVQDNGLAGSMFWEASYIYPSDSSLTTRLTVMARV